MSKAGGIDISDPIGSLLVGGIQGCYSNCVGFPTRRLYRVLRRDFADLFEAAF
jgi:predicted house-cleaning NTP pyrophosphatase (Maf/HAM1 superfamily)